MTVEEELEAAKTALAEKDAALKQLNTDLAAVKAKQRASDATVSQLQSDKDGHDAALAQARLAGADEARNALKGEQAKVIALAELRVLAAKRLHDPDDAARYIDQVKILGADGSFDATAANTQLDELLTARPYLAGTGGGAPPPPPPGKPAGDANGGVRPPAPLNDDARMNAALRAAVNKH
jgi:hypothetical protein